MKPLVHVSFAHFGQTKEMTGLPEKILFLGSALFPPTSVTVWLSKRQNLFLPTLIWAGTISKAIPK